MFTKGKPTLYQFRSLLLSTEIRQSEKAKKYGREMCPKWSSAFPRLESRGGPGCLGFPWASSTASSHRHCGISRCCQRSCLDYRGGNIQLSRLGDLCVRQHRPAGALPSASVGLALPLTSVPFCFQRDRSRVHMLKALPLVCS